MYYHASQNSNIKTLEPRISNHGIPLIYFSDKRENVLVYLSNAVEKYCKETGFEYDGIYSKWGPYSFTEDGILQLEEYYPDATYDTYKGVEGYIYRVENIKGIKKLDDIPHAYITNQDTPITSVEYIEDAYEEIMKAVSQGLIKLVKYEDFIKTKKDWLDNIIEKEYSEATNHPEYRYFLENKFTNIRKK